jgi:hypothetical protein
MIWVNEPGEHPGHTSLPFGADELPDRACGGHGPLAAIYLPEAHRACLDTPVGVLSLTCVGLRP